METAESVHKECGKDMSSVDLVCYKTAVAAEYTNAAEVCWNRIMPTKENRDHKPEKEKESKQEVRDLPPKKDVKAGNSKENGHTSSRTGEVDFMWDYD